MSQTPANTSVPKIVSKSPGAREDSRDIEEKIQDRRSRELIIGICGAIGAGINDLQSELKIYLEAEKYIVEIIKISDLIPALKNDTTLLTLRGFERYKSYQDAGNKIRGAMRNHRLAQAAIQEIIKKRSPHLDKSSEAEDKHKTTKPIAYIINQLKNPAEVGLLQKVYPRNFYLLGLISPEVNRKKNLKSIPMSTAEADQLVEIDRRDNERYGQQVEKTIYLSDYFIRDGHSNSLYLRSAIKRFVNMIHGVNGITPTKDEVGMYTASSAALNSACLSRQVGAAIVNNLGDILSTGCNDVPKSGGGLYSAEDDKNDHRCVFSGKKCFNDFHKSLLEKAFQEILEKNSVSDAKKIASELFKNSPAKDLIEYSRAVHAEMDALIQLARTEGQSTIGATLYCTTYPCHSCARHIVAAGIKRVIYIEPYEKSLALELHADSISTTEEVNKVAFTPFEGVAPQRYFKFFKMMPDTRKKDGQALFSNPSDSHHVDAQYLDSYYDYEERVAKEVETEINPFLAA